MAKRPVSVIEFAGYRRRASELLTAGQRDAVIRPVAYEPTCGDIIPGSGGFEETSVLDATASASGAAHASSTIFTMRIFAILLLALYAKNEKSDLTIAERRAICGLYEGDREAMESKNDAQEQPACRRHSREFTRGAQSCFGKGDKGNCASCHSKGNRSARSAANAWSVTGRVRRPDWNGSWNCTEVGAWYAPPFRRSPYAY